MPEGLCEVCGKEARTPGVPRMCGKHDKPLLHCAECHELCGRTVKQIGSFAEIFAEGIDAQKARSPIANRLKQISAARAESDTTLATPKTEALKLVESCLQNAPAPVPAPRPEICTTSRKDKAPFSLQQLAKEYTNAALETIVEIMDDREQEGSTRLDAAKALLDRGWGKPTATIKQETIKYTLNDLQKALVEKQDEIEQKMEEARSLESEHLAGYIEVDATVVEDVASRSSTALQDYS